MLEVFANGLFAAPRLLVLGALTGLVFGFLLRRGHVTRFEVIVGQFLLRDFTVLKVMGTAIVVGAIGVYGMLGLGLIDNLHVKSAHLLGNALGGLIFGVGMAVLGYCPGTGAAALGDGSRHVATGLLGMLVGAALYAEVQPWADSAILSVGELGEATVSTATGLSPWWFIAAMGVVAVVGFTVLEGWEKRRPAVET